MNPMTDSTGYLLEFFKVLADEKRLQIVGLLAEGEYSVEELAAILDLSPATVSHHLRRLVDVGLVAARADQHYHIYRLDADELHRQAQEILSPGRLQAVAEDLDLDAYDRKVRHDYLEDGRLKQWPGQWKKRQVIHRYLVDKFEPGRRYPEREVNQIIGQVYEDFATFRRELVDTGLLKRERDVYWRPE